MQNLYYQQGRGNLCRGNLGEEKNKAKYCADASSVHTDYTKADTTIQIRGVYLCFIRCYK
jgi:hypothetical protein